MRGTLMKIFSYNPPKLKPSTKRTKVKDEQGNVVCWFERVYPNVIAKMCNYVFGIDWSAQIQVYSADGHPVFQCNKKHHGLGGRNIVFSVVIHKTFLELHIRVGKKLLQSLKSLIKIKSM